MLRLRRISFQIEADRHVEIHVLARPVRRRWRERLRAAQQCRASSSSEAAPDERTRRLSSRTPLPIEAEKDLGDALLTARAGQFRIALA